MYMSVWNYLKYVLSIFSIWSISKLKHKINIIVIEIPHVANS